MRKLARGIPHITLAALSVIHKTIDKLQQSFGCHIARQAEFT
jgi:hypothetical protein